MRNIKVHTRPVEIGQEMSPLEVENCHARNCRYHFSYKRAKNDIS